MEAIVLAGGRGTRLSPVISDRPKVLAEVSGRPFLSYVLDLLYRCGVTHAVLAVGYMADSVERTFGNSYEGILIDYSKEEAPLGTGGAVKKALELCNDDNVLVVNGDTVFDVELEEMMNEHGRTSADISVAIKHMENFERYGTVETDGEIITRFNEKKPCAEGYINGGVYVINRAVISGFAGESFSFEKAILENAAIKKAAFVSDGFFIDIGIPQDYIKAQELLPAALSEKRRKALFLDRDGTLNIEKHHVYRIEDFEFTNGMPELIKNYREKGYLVIVVTNQAGIAKGMYTEKDVDILHSYINEVLIRDYKTCIDAFFYCPHHPEGIVPEYTKRCQCRKPEPGLIYKAVEYFSEKGIRLDLAECVLMGDKQTDLNAGAAAGISELIKIY